MKKYFKSKDRSQAECFACKKKGHWKKDCPNRGGSSNGNTGITANSVQCSDVSSSEEDLLCVSSVRTKMVLLIYLDVLMITKILIQ